MALIVLTGAAGKVATLIRPLLVDAGHRLRLVDIVPIAAASPAQETITGSCADFALMKQALSGADLLVHLAGFSSERPLADILTANVEASDTVLRAAVASGVRRVVLASSVHAVGCVPTSEASREAVPAMRPDTYYGVGKVALEALGSLYADRFGLSVLTVRFMTVESEPSQTRSLSTWCSPGDAARVVLAGLTLEGPAHHIVWGVSANRDRWVSLDAGHDVGFTPSDDAAQFTGDVPPPSPQRTELERLGGFFLDPARPVGGSW